jgi:hypothetical protein
MGLMFFSTGTCKVSSGLCNMSITSSNCTITITPTRSDPAMFDYHVARTRETSRGLTTGSQKRTKSCPLWLSDFYDRLSIL